MRNVAREKPSGQLHGRTALYRSTNLGAYGEGRTIAVFDPLLRDRARSLRAHGTSKRYEHDEVGFSYRMDGIQGAVPSAKLPYLDGRNEHRRLITAAYDGRLSGACRMPRRPAFGESVFRMDPFLVEDRRCAQDSFAAASVETSAHYPIPCHLQKAYVGLGYSGRSSPVSEMAAEQELSLPSRPEMPDDIVRYVAHQGISCPIGGLYSASFQSSRNSREPSDTRVRLVRGRANPPFARCRRPATTTA